MSISGTTNTCQILTNTPFVLSGLSQTNLSTINITDVNGLDVSECFGITSKIITVDGDNVTLTGDCNTSLEINVTEGVINEVECLYTAVTPNNEGILIFNFVDGTISDNIHPECCTALEGVPEIGPKNYYICRVIPVVCVECCSAYTPTNTFEGLYQIFDFVTGGTVTTVPSAQCCYDYGFVESVVGGQVKCIEYVEPDPCEGLEVVLPVPQYGDITFVNPSTNVQTTLVPTAECCTSLGYSFAISGTKFTCFNSIAPPPTVSITNDPCCLGTARIYDNILLRDCDTGLNYNARRLSSRTYTVGDVIQYLRLADSSLYRCATIIATDYVSGFEDATFAGTSSVSYDCGDTRHCNIPNTNPI